MVVVTHAVTKQCAMFTVVAGKSIETQRDELVGLIARGGVVLAEGRVRKLKRGARGRQVLPLRGGSALSVIVDGAVWRRSFSGSGRDDMTAVEICIPTVFTCDFIVDAADADTAFSSFLPVAPRIRVIHSDLGNLGSSYPNVGTHVISLRLRRISSCLIFGT